MNLINIHGLAAQSRVVSRFKHDDSICWDGKKRKVCLHVSHECHLVNKYSLIIYYEVNIIDLLYIKYPPACKCAL